MITSFKLAHQIQKSDDFKQVIWSNYKDHSNGMSMKEYASQEKKILSMGNYGVEDFHLKVKEYCEFLDELIRP